MVIVSTIGKVGSPIDLRARELGAVGVLDKEELGFYKGNESPRVKYLAALKAAAMSIVRGQ